MIQNAQIFGHTQLYSLHDAARMLQLTVNIVQLMQYMCNANSRRSGWPTSTVGECVRGHGPIGVLDALGHYSQRSTRVSHLEVCTYTGRCTPQVGARNSLALFYTSHISGG